MREPVVVAYIPVLHEGYRRFLERHGRGRRAFLIGPELYADYRPLAKDVRALDAAVAAAAVAALGICSEVGVLDAAGAPALAGAALTLPDEDVSHQVVERWFPRAEITYDSAFLRWDKTRTVRLLEPRPARTASELAALAAFVTAEGSETVQGAAAGSETVRGAAAGSETVQGAAAGSGGAGDAGLTALAGAAAGEAARSVDWWRQVGAALRLADGGLLTAHNEHRPHPLSPYAVGDPRSNFSKGVHLELSTAMHAEARLIAEAAASGRSTRGATLYVTDFPCPPCAKLIAAAGIERVYYRDGYAVLDGEDVLNAAGVEIVHVSPQSVE